MTPYDRKCAEHAQNAADTWAKLDALKGAPTLEQMHGITQHVAGTRIIELTAQRDELLAALKEAHRLLPSLIHTSTDIDAVELGDAIERARAAIARAEGR